MNHLITKIAEKSRSDFPLFNGNHKNDLRDFNKYLGMYKYKFENINNEVGGYAVLKNKHSILAMDVGNSPASKFSYSYQSGTLSFEFIVIGQTSSNPFLGFTDNLHNSFLSGLSMST